MKNPSFKLSRTQESTVCARAEKEGLSVSEYIDRLLIFGEESKKMGEVRIDSKTLKGVLECASENELAEAGRKFGEIIPEAYLRSMNRPCDLESCYYLLNKLLGEHNNWYEFKIEETPEATRFTFIDSNELGEKWLRFVKEYATALIRSVVKADAKASITGTRVSLEIPKPKR